MGSARLGYGLESRCRGFAIFQGNGDISQRQDPDESLISVQHRQAPDLMVSHSLGRNLDVLILQADDQVISRHHLTHLGGEWVESVGGRADGNVAIGDHPDQSVHLTNGQNTDIERMHPFRSIT